MIPRCSIARCTTKSGPIEESQQCSAVKYQSINQHAYDCNINDTDQSSFAEAIAFFFGSLNQSIDGEGHDRVSITLPDIQLTLVQQLEKVACSPLHVVIMAGSSLDLSFIRDSSRYASLMWAGYPGQSGGVTIANVVFGQYNPSGRLPITFYPASYVNEVAMTDMSMRPSSVNPGRILVEVNRSPLNL